MSNRTLIEINHDKWMEIEKNEKMFVSQLLCHLQGGDFVEELEQFGVRVIGMKHHSDDHNIIWGGHEERQDKSDS